MHLLWWNISMAGFLAKSVIFSGNKQNSLQKAWSSDAVCLLGMQETQFSMAEKGCSGTLMWMSHVLGSGFIPGRNEIFWQLLSSCANFSPGHTWDPGMTHAMGEVTFMEGLQTSNVTAGGCEGRALSLIAGFFEKWSLPRQCQTCSVRPRYPRGHLTQIRREAMTLHYKEVGYSSARGRVQDRSQLRECLAKCGRLVRSVFEDFFLSLNIFKWSRFCCYTLNSCFSDSLSSCFQLKRELSSFYSSLFPNVLLC